MFCYKYFIFILYYHDIIFVIILIIITVDLIILIIIFSCLYRPYALPSVSLVDIGFVCNEVASRYLLLNYMLRYEFSCKSPEKKH